MRHFCPRARSAREADRGYTVCIRRGRCYAQDERTFRRALVVGERLTCGAVHEAVISTDKVLAFKIQSNLKGFYSKGISIQTSRANLPAWKRMIGEAIICEGLFRRPKPRIYP